MSETITYRASVYSTTAASVYSTTGTYTPAPNSLLIAFVVGCVAASPTDPDHATAPFAGHGVGWTKLTLAANTLGGTHALSVWVAKAGGSPSSAACTAQWATNRTGCAIIEFEVTGADLSGTAAQAIAQNPTTTGTGTGTGNQTLASPASALNRALACFLHLANEGTTPRAGWTETAGADGNFNNPATGFEASFRSDAFETTYSATWISNVAWRAVALEIKAAPDISGALARTLGSLSRASAGAVTVSGALARTLDSLSRSAAGVVAISGASAKTLAPLSPTAAAQVAITGSLSRQIAAVSIAAAGAEQVRGAVNVSLQPLTGVATGQTAAEITGALSQSLGPVSPLARGETVIRAQAARLLDSLSIVGSGSAAIQAQSAIALQQAQGAAGGQLSIAGASAKTIEAIGVQAAASLSITGAATGAIALTGQAFGQIRISAQAAPALQAVQGAAQSAVSIKGASSIALGALAASASGEGASAASGTLDVELDGLSIVATGMARVSARLDSLIETLSLSAHAGNEILGQSQAIITMSLAATAVVTDARNGLLAQTLAEFTVSSLGIVGAKKVEMRLSTRSFILRADARSVTSHLDARAYLLSMPFRPL